MFVCPPHDTSERKKSYPILAFEFFLTSPSERFAVALAIFTITSRRMSFCRWSSCRSRQSRSYVGLAVLEKRKETVSGNAYHHPADGWITTKRMVGAKVDAPCCNRYPK